ncbi:hypothetical protein GCM10010521_32820 [Streptomyces rameus]|uniref:Uncharacterized protein n=1 Tax=Streptomyces rameus TaxID=68261 RepID=A0ABP6NC59_9ACTN
MTDPARRRAAHRQAGRPLRRFHDAPPAHQAQDAAVNVVASTAAGLDEHIAEAGDRPDHPELRASLFEGYGRTPTEAEERALAAFAAADAAGALAYGARHGDTFVTTRGRPTVERLTREGRR